MVFSAAAILYPALLMFYVWRFAGSPENKIIYAERRFEFDDEFINGYLPDGSESKFRYDHITRVERSTNHYQLHLSRTQVVCIPVRAFHSQEDRDGFDSLLREKGLG
jgi:hypothetical protein